MKKILLNVINSTRHHEESQHHLYIVIMLPRPARAILWCPIFDFIFETTWRIESFIFKGKIFLILGPK